MAGPGNQHCANCIGALSFLMDLSVCMGLDSEPIPHSQLRP